jgi:hypothetical protein
MLHFNREHGGFIVLRVDYPPGQSTHATGDDVFAAGVNCGFLAGFKQIQKRTSLSAQF